MCAGGSSEQACTRFYASQTHKRSECFEGVTDRSGFLEQSLPYWSSRAALAWVGYARLIRGEVLSIRERDFVEAARALGTGDARIMFRHILPNAVAPVIVTATLSFGSMILTESALSFLGLGVSTLVPTWGKMVADARDYVTTAWYPSVFPALAIMLVVLGANLLGDWLRDILDPRLRGRPH